MSLRRNVLAGLMAGGCLLTSAAGTLRAQQPMPVPQATANPKGVESARSAAVAAARDSGAPAAAAKDALKTYTEYLMAKMTEPSRDKTPDKWRAELTSQFIVPIKSEEARATVAKTAVAKAVEIIDGNYIPQAKINAMLVLTELRIAREALSPLYKYATATDAAKAVPPHLRSLALYGLDQYVRAAGASMPAAQRTQLAKAVAEVVKSEPTLLREEKAHWWMVRRAFDVLVSLHAASASTTEGPTVSAEAVKRAMVLFMDPAVLPSVRISAGQYLSRYDLSKTDDATRNKILVAVAQLLDQEVVGWYEQEQDKTQSSSGMGMMAGMGGYGGMGMTGAGAEGYGAAASGYGAMAYGAGGAGTGAGSGPRPVETQKWDLRLARRKLNTYCQLAHILLMGTGADEHKRYSSTGTGIMETDLPESLQRPARRLLEALEQVQTDINEPSLTDINTLMTRSVKSLGDLRTAAEEVPGMTGADGAVIVPSFNELAPRKKSVKKADAKTTLEAPKTPEQMAAEQAAAAGGNPPTGEQPAGEQPVGEQPTGEQPAGGQPAGGQPAGGQPAAGAGQPAAGNQPAANQPPGNGAAGNPAPAANPPAGNNPAAGQ